MRLIVREYIQKKYGRYVDCYKCRPDGEQASDDQPVYQYIADEDDEYVYLECPECGLGGQYEKPAPRETRFVVTG